MSEALILDSIYPIASVPEDTWVLVRNKAMGSVGSWVRAKLTYCDRRKRMKWLFDVTVAFPLFIPTEWKMLP